MTKQLPKHEKNFRKLALYLGIFITTVRLIHSNEAWANAHFNFGATLLMQIGIILLLIYLTFESKFHTVNSDKKWRIWGMKDLKKLKIYYQFARSVFVLLIGFYFYHTFLPTLSDLPYFWRENYSVKVEAKIENYETDVALKSLLLFNDARIELEGIDGEFKVYFMATQFQVGRVHEIEYLPHSKIIVKHHQLPLESH